MYEDTYDSDEDAMATAYHGVSCEPDLSDRGSALSAPSPTVLNPPPPYEHCQSPPPSQLYPPAWATDDVHRAARAKARELYRKRTLKCFGLDDAEFSMTPTVPGLVEFSMSADTPLRCPAGEAHVGTTCLRGILVRQTQGHHHQIVFRCAIHKQKKALVHKVPALVEYDPQAREYRFVDPPPGQHPNEEEEEDELDWDVIRRILASKENLADVPNDGTDVVYRWTLGHGKSRHFHLPGVHLERALRLLPRAVQEQGDQAVGVSTLRSMLSQDTGCFMFGTVILALESPEAREHARTLLVHELRDIIRDHATLTPLTPQSGAATIYVWFYARGEKRLDFHLNLLTREPPAPAAPAPPPATRFKPYPPATSAPETWGRGVAWGQRVRGEYTSRGLVFEDLGGVALCGREGVRQRLDLATDATANELAQFLSPQKCFCNRRVERECPKHGGYRHRTGNSSTGTVLD